MSPGECAKVLSFLDCKVLPFLSLKRTIGPECVFFRFLYAKSTSKTLKSEVEKANARAEEFFGARQTSDDSPKITLGASRVAAAFLPAHSHFAPDSKSSMRICFCLNSSAASRIGAADISSKNLLNAICITLLCTNMALY